MNKDNAKDYLPLVQALAEGKVIQMYSGGVWRDLDPEAEMFIDDRITYRIKPEPREIWVRRNEKGVNASYSYPSKAMAENEIPPGWTAVRYREVIE